MRAGGDAKAAKQKQECEKQSGDGSEREAVECERVTERADVVRGTEEQA